MTWTTIIWDDSEDGNVDHIAEHGFSMEDVEFVLSNFDRIEESRSTGRTIVLGWMGSVRVGVVVDEIDDETIYPVTAYEVS